MAVLPYLVALVGIGIVVAGVIAAVVPGLIRDRFELFRTERFLLIAVIGRIFLGFFFLVASESCGWPLAIGTVGVLALIAGFSAAFLGITRLKELMPTFLPRTDATLRAMSGAAIAFGAFVVYAAL